MKLLLENWRKYLNEEKQNTYSFDFDNTLIRYQTLEDGDVVYLGPHEENLQILRDLAAEGNKVIIVTSRFKLKGPKKPWDDAPTPEELVADLSLPVEVIEYTDGELKTSKLLGMPYNIIKHWDDDQDEVNALADTGIQGVKVEVPGEETERLRAKWVHNLSQELQEGGMEIPEGMKTYLKNHPYMEPDGLQAEGEGDDCFSRKTFDGKVKCMKRTKGYGQERAQATVAKVLRAKKEIKEAHNKD